MTMRAYKAAAALVAVTLLSAACSSSGSSSSSGSGASTGANLTFWNGFTACHDLFCLTQTQPVVPPPLPTHIEPPNLTEITITEAPTP